MAGDIQLLTDQDLAYKIVLLKALTDLVLAEFDQAKRIADEQFAKGTSIPARTTADEKLGRVTKSDPKPVADVVDADALDKWLRTEYTDQLISTSELADLGEVAAALVDAGRGDLIRTMTTVPAHLVGLAKTRALRGEAVPGVAVRTPRGTVSARTERAAVDTVRQLLAGSPVPLLGIEA